jgi:thiamine biosynthesis lipoprotein
MIRCQPLLGTYVEVCVESNGWHESELSQAIDEAFMAIRTVQACMSVFEPQSDLARINAGAFMNHAGEVHPWLWDVLNLSQQIHALSPIFDITVGHMLVPSGIRPLIKRSFCFGTMADLILCSDCMVKTLRPLYLDLGGIAKGYAVDRAVEVLQQRGVESGCVNAGGDLRVWGERTHEVHVREDQPPYLPRKAGVLQEGAIATSANYFVKAKSSGSGGHLVDPMNQTVSDTKKSFTVIASQCALADALTKVYAISQNAQHSAIAAMGGIGLELCS